ncbi:MAG: CpsD/CapB family tyrosine-protein kinase [Candidatus Acidiferrum sp.]
MSRIHEALKRAAEERSVKKPHPPREAPLDIPKDTHWNYSVQDVEIPLELRALRTEERAVPFSIEELEERCIHAAWQPDGRFDVFRGRGPAKNGAEKFRTLRSRLYQIAGTKALKTLLVTSSVATEGKTFVALNLGRCFVHQPNRRVLLIDCDLRVPHLHAGLGAPTHPGLTDYLCGDLDECSVIQRGKNENLFFIAAGTEMSNPSELLSNGRIQRLLNLVAPAFDWVVIDSPPALYVHDASTLADLCDGVLFVVKAGATDSQLAEKAISEFREKNLLGVVLNGVDKSDSYGDYENGYGADSSQSET